MIAVSFYFSDICNHIAIIHAVKASKEKRFHHFFLDSFMSAEGKFGLF